jgi:superfamily II DNA or RNA helicase
MQLDLYGAEPHEKAKAKASLRPYQARIVAEAVSAIGQGRSPLIEAATGTGKTRIGTEIVNRLDQRRFLWLAHRTELIWQATRSIGLVAGTELVGHELPDLASSGERIVVASKDTIRQPKRLERLKQGKPFDVIVIDECHHAAAASYRAILDAFPAALRIGLSATPDRHDKARLRCFDTYTTPYRIVDAIRDSWLVPFKAKKVRIDAVDLSGVKVVAGDFAAGELELVMKSEAALHGCAEGLFREIGSRPAIVFVAGVDQASRLCEVLNRYRRLCSRFVTGSTDPDSRQSLFRTFGRDYQILVNVAVATEGTDLPAAACIAMMRPTKSRGLYTQMLGRGGRPLPGLEGDTPDARMGWIRSSLKPDCLVLDFVGNTGRHSIVSAFEVAGADETVTRKAAKRYQEGELVDVFEAIQQEEAREAPARAKRAAKAAADAAARADIVARVSLSVTDTELIGLGEVPQAIDPGAPLWTETVTPGQAAQLVRYGLAAGLADQVLTKGQARKIILDERKRLGYATPKQLDFVKKHCPGEWSPELTKKRAKFLILSKIRGWNRG